jgi:hypothetical protein
MWATSKLYSPPKLFANRAKPEDLERVMGIEPTSSAWKAEVLPLNYTRLNFQSPSPNPGFTHHFAPFKMVEGGGFEPPKA